MMTTTKHHTLARPEGAIAYDVTGQGPLVVCVPGMGELRSTYRETVPALVAAGYRVATMDLRGHGGSDATFSSYDDVAAGTDILALIDELGGPAVVLGNSMGAGAAVWAAAERPDAVAGLALIGPFVRNTPMNPLLAFAFKAMMTGPWAPAMWTGYMPKLYPGRRPDDYDAHVAEMKESLRLPGHRRAFVATTRTSHAPAEDRLGSVTAPTLVVMGTADPDFPDPAAEAQWISEQLHADVTLVEGAGHYPQVEQPEAVNAALVSLLGKAHRA